MILNEGIKGNKEFHKKLEREYTDYFKKMDFVTLNSPSGHGNIGNFASLDAKGFILAFKENNGPVRDVISRRGNAIRTLARRRGVETVLMRRLLWAMGLLIKKQSVARSHLHLHLEYIPNVSKELGLTLKQIYDIYPSLKYEYEKNSKLKRKIEKSINKKSVGVFTKDELSYLKRVILKK